MATVERILAPVRELGRERLSFLAYVTGGHTVVHWYQQIFAVVLPSMKQGMGLSDVEVGYVQSVRQAASGALNLPAGIIADTFVRRQAVILASAIVFMGLGYLLVGIAPTLIWLLPGAALVGLGSAVWHPPAMGALSARFPERRATVLAVHGVGATFGDTLTPLAVGALLVAFHWRGVLEWQIVPAVLAALVIWRGLAHQFPETGPRPTRASLVRDMGRVMRDPVFMSVSLAQGFMSMSRQVILTFLPIYIQIELGYDAFELGVYVAMLHGMGTVSQPVLGIVSDRIGRKWVLVPSYLVLAVLFTLLGRAAPGWQLAVLVLAIGVFFYTLTNITTAAALDVAGARAQASTSGLATILSQVMVLPSPVLAGWLVERQGYGAAFVMAGAFMAAGAVVMLPWRMYQGSRRTPRFSG